MREIIIAVYMTGGFIFLGSVALYVYTRAKLYPHNDPELDDVYYEFEERHLGYARYLKWSRISLGGVALGMLLLFLGAAL
jgi:hypothetical protein